MTPYRALFAGEALEKFLAIPDVRTVLDVGAGDGMHTAVMKAAGKQVKAISLKKPADFVGDYLHYEAPDFVDGIWASHVLEHQPNVQRFLRKCFEDLRPEGVLAITVPPPKHALVGGHLNLYNQGILVYNLILAGFDCREAHVSETYVGGPLDIPYNISVLVRKREAKLPRLAMDAGDIELLARFFPVPVWQEVDGRFSANWEKEV